MRQNRPLARLVRRGAARSAGRRPPTESPRRPARAPGPAALHRRPAPERRETMPFFSWLRDRASAPARRARARRPSAAPRYRPRLEALEGRDVPSTLTVTNTLDSGPGSLRAEIAAAKNNTTIVFDPSVHGTITLTGGELDITSSVTIQ